MYEYGLQFYVLMTFYFKYHHVWVIAFFTCMLSKVYPFTGIYWETTGIGYLFFTNFMICYVIDTAYIIRANTRQKRKVILYMNIIRG